MRSNADHLTCPECAAPALCLCRCPLADRSCLSGHAWHSCPLCYAVVRGAGDHGRATADPANLCGACRAAGRGS